MPHPGPPVSPRVLGLYLLVRLFTCSCSVSLGSSNRSTPCRPSSPLDGHGQDSATSGRASDRTLRRFGIPSTCEHLGNDSATR